MTKSVKLSSYYESSLEQIETQINLLNILANDFIEQFPRLSVQLNSF
jgi:hypothetical protein